MWKKEVKLKLFTNLFWNKITACSTSTICVLVVQQQHYYGLVLSTGF